MVTEIEVSPDEGLVVVGSADELVDTARVVAVLRSGDVDDPLDLGGVSEGGAAGPGGGVAGRRLFATPVDVAQEKGAVAEDRPAQRCTELLILQHQDFLVGRTRADKVFVTEHIEPGTVNLIGAA